MKPCIRNGYIYIYKIYTNDLLETLMIENLQQIYKYTILKTFNSIKKKYKCEEHTIEIIYKI